MNDKKFIAYCHIGKVGGKQLHFYLRSHFGIRYRGVANAVGRRYTEKDLQLELKINPLIRYIGGHDVRPSVDFGKFENQISWFSFFREPKERLLSHYYQQQQSGLFKDLSIVEWLEKHATRKYWNIFMISGENNLDKAIDIVDAKYDFVGLTRQYEESLFLFAHHYNLRNFRFHDQSSKKPPEKDELFLEIKGQAAEFSNQIDSALQDEYTFYRYIENRYQQQRSAYGEENLIADVEKYLSLAQPVKKLNLNNAIAVSADHLLWRPLTKLRRILLAGNKNR